MNATTIDLQKAIKLVERDERKKVEADHWRLQFHLMPPVGWLNDPNGLCQFKGAYHVFFQYAPFNAKGGLKVWGHYSSKDWICWQYHGAPIVPDQAQDVHGVYSGSAFVEDDTLYLYYTGNVKDLGTHDYIRSGREANTLLITTSDLKTYSDKQLLMQNADYGEEMSCHVRDPKVWKAGDTYYMVQGARSLGDKGQVIVFSSKDKYNWQRINTLTTAKKFGFMWECPDLFCLSGHTILSFSPQGVSKRGFDFWNVYQSGYCFLAGDFTSDNYQLGAFKEFDRGFDFYAPQTFEDDKGRRILIAWMGLPDCEPEYTNPTIANGWQHCLTLPRELLIKDGRLYQQPLEEFKALRGAQEVYRIAHGTSVNTHLCAEILLSDIADQDLSVIISNEVKLSYSHNEKTFVLQFWNESGAGRDKRIVKLSHLHTMRIFKDTSSLEIFLNDGEEVLTTRYYPESTADMSIEILYATLTLTQWHLRGFSYKR